MGNNNTNLMVVDGDSISASGIDFKPIEELIDRDASEVTQRIIPYFEPDADKVIRWGSLKGILKSLVKK